MELDEHALRLLGYYTVDEDGENDDQAGMGKQGAARSRPGWSWQGRQRETAAAAAATSPSRLPHSLHGLDSSDKMVAARDPTLSVLLPILILLSTLLFLLVFFLVFLLILRQRRRRGIALLDSEGPIDLAREEEFEGEGGLAGVEERWLENQDDPTRIGYGKSKGE